jgi:hypothetical protein
VCSIIIFGNQPYKLKKKKDIWKYENELEGKHLDGSRESRLRCCEMDEPGSELSDIACTVHHLAIWL